MGNGYRPSNGGGDLHFLGKAYRKLHHLGEPRKRRPWFNKSWYISIEMLKNHMARIMGDEFGSAFDTLTERERGVRSTNIRGASLSLVPRFVGLRIALSVRNEQHRKPHVCVSI